MKDCHMQDKISRFIDCYIPVTTCNLRCHYCYITLAGKFKDELPKFQHSAEYMAKALSRKRLGGTCALNLCGGGETLLPPEMPGIIKAFLEEGHYVSVITNGTLTNRYKEIVAFDKAILKRLFFKFSFHYLELLRLSAMEKFFANIKMVSDAGCSFSLEITPNDELIPHIEDIKKTALKYVGALPHITVARDSRKKELPILTELSREEYCRVWSRFDSGMFKFKISVFEVPRKEFCYAGSWTYSINLGTGDLFQCYCGDKLMNIYDDISAPIKKRPIGRCREPHCFNAHAWLTFGDIPELATPPYLEMRDRVTEDGSHSVKEPVRSFFQSRLKDSNPQMTRLGEKIYLLRKKFHF